MTCSKCGLTIAGTASRCPRCLAVIQPDSQPGNSVTNHPPAPPQKNWENDLSAAQNYQYKHPDKHPEMEQAKNKAFEALMKKRNFSFNAVCSFGISALPKGFWGVDTNIFKGTGLDASPVGFILRIFSFLLLTVPFILIGFIINLFKLIYYEIEISRYKKEGLNVMSIL